MPILGSQLVLETPCLQLPSDGVTVGDYMFPPTIIYMGPGDLNSESHAFVASTSTTEPSPNPHAAVRTEMVPRGSRIPSVGCQLEGLFWSIVEPLVGRALLEEVGY